MKEIKDPAIKLFGMKIPLPENGEILIVSGEEPEFDDSDDVVSMEDNGFNRSGIETHFLEDKKVSSVVEGAEQEAKKDPILEKPSETKQQDLTPSLITLALTNPETVSESNENPKTPSIDEETATPKPPNTENDQSDTNDSDQKTLKKPDKIIPCPRCNSMDTKFCYYNNYNINQPRHFCKSCQRYWTSGGTMRNVPVGAGRRKNKNSASHCRQITISEVLQAAKIDVQNGINGTVLSFGSDGMICESMASVMNLVDKRPPRNGYYKFDSGNSGSCDDCSGGSSVTTSNSTEEGRKNGFQEPTIGSLNGVPTQIPCLPGVPWPYPWNLGLSMPFYPVPYLNCGLPGSWNGLQSSWSVPKLSPISPTINHNSPNLGKHSRDGDLIKPTKNPEEKEAAETKDLERSILIPKTLRIDDPDEAAKSSIWATLGIKNEFKSRGGLFKAFQPKGDQKNHVAQPSPALWANPAAFSRSQSFQESS